jgi:hypothetical protein
MGAKMKCQRRGTDERIKLRLKAHGVVMRYRMAVFNESREIASKEAFDHVKGQEVENLNKIIREYESIP